MGYLSDQILFKLRVHYSSKVFSLFQKLKFSVFGLRIGKRTSLSDCRVNWPHQVSIGNDCILEHNLYFKFDGIWRQGPSIVILNSVFIGSNCEFNIRMGILIEDNVLIASGCRFIDHDHGIVLGELIRKQSGPEKEIIIRNDVWIGCNVVILKGVEIGAGAIVAAGAVVTKSIPSNEIWGGIPAKKIGERRSL
jgi:acetyltransferase-like isoleucine patch superfamily enzyme